MKSLRHEKRNSSIERILIHCHRMEKYQHLWLFYTHAARGMHEKLFQICDSSVLGMPSSGMYIYLELSMY